jgi:hypothetical protein
MLKRLDYAWTPGIIARMPIAQLMEFADDTPIIRDDVLAKLNAMRAEKGLPPINRPKR